MKKTTVKVTRGDIVVAYTAINNILNELEKGNEKLAYWLSRNLRILEPETRFRDELIKKFGETDPRGQIVVASMKIEEITDEEGKSFEPKQHRQVVNPRFLEWQEANNTESEIETEIDIFMIPLSLIEKGFSKGTYIRDTMFLWECKDESAPPKSAE